MILRSVIVLVLLAIFAANSSSEESGGTAINLDTIWTTFGNDGLEFRARLLLPADIKPHAVVIFVHGSEQFAATDYYKFAYGFARRGIASLTFDKRGTGGSGGAPTPDFRILASDVSAAIDFLSRNELLGHLPRGLIAVSQGGWVAPLVAQDRNDIDFLIIDSGSALSPQENDRWVTEQWMHKAGATETGIEDAQPLMDAVYATIRCSFRCSWQELQSIKEMSTDAPWRSILSTAETNVGFVLNADRDQLLAILESMGVGEENNDFTLDPVSLISRSDEPILWLLGENDDLVPAVRSAQLLEELAASRTATLEVVLCSNQGHSLISRLAMADKWNELEPVLAFIQAQVSP